MDDLNLTPAERDQLERFADAVAHSPHNLVSRAARAELLTRHVPECVRFARMLPQTAGSVLDLGSGGGFPGLVIAVIRPDLDVHVMDGTRKKTQFLAEISQDLGLEVTVHTGRAEELGTGPLASQFELVTARAVAPLQRLVAWALPLLRVGGQLYAMKGERWREEITDAAAVLRRTGASVVATPDDQIVDGETGPDPSVVIISRAR